MKRKRERESAPGDPPPIESTLALVERAGGY
jgi:hypothetical protein